MAKPKRPSHSARRMLRGSHRAQDPHQHGLHRTMEFNRTSSRTRQRKPDEEVVTIPVPSLIEPHVFEQVQRQLHARSPRVVAPRVTSGPILLTGLAVCATCGGGMTLRTGTSQNGIVHRYYTCSTCARKGKSACTVDPDGQAGPARN